MIKNLLSAKWQHDDPAVRRRTIEEGRLDDSVLFELAKTDPEPEIRNLAVSRIQNLEQLIELAECIDDADKVGVPARLHDLILAADPANEPDRRMLQRCYVLCADEQQRRSLLLHAPFAVLREMAAEGLRDEEALEQCALSDRAVEVRYAAIRHINNEDSLRRIAKQLRGNDKSTARLAEDRRAALQQQREQAAQQQALLEEMQACAEGRQPIDDVVFGKLTARWETIAEGADDGARQRYEALEAALQPLLEQHHRELEQERAGRKQRKALLESLGDLEAQCLQRDADETRQHLAATEASWRGLPAMLNASAQQALEQDFEEAVLRIHVLIRQQRKQDELRQRLDAMIANLEKRLQADRLSEQDVSKAREQSESLTGTIEDRQAHQKPLQRIRNLVEKLEHRLSEQKAQEKALREKLQTHIEALEKALEEQTLRAALKAHKQAHDLLIAAGDHRPASFKRLEQRLHHSEPALRELKSWRNYGTDHAREELLKEAAALRDAPPANVEKLAKRLTDLRARWKQLGPLEPGGKALWEQFDEACTQAHEPVKAKHDAEAEARRQNLEQRKAICERLEALAAQTDSEQPDWHALDKAMAAARRDWKKTGGVPHKAWPAIRKRFDKAVRNLDEQLAPERERNFNDRQRLVFQAEQLAQQEDNRAATAAARELRKQWQVTVRSHTRKENQLWQAFNKAMDQVFQQHRAERDQFMASLDEHQHKAEALCGQLEQLARLDNQAVRSRRPELQQVMDQFAALNLPNRARRQLENRFDKACKALEQRLESAEDALRREQLDQLYILHRLCAEMEAIALSPAPDPEQANELQARWTAADKPAREKSALHHLEQRFEAARAVINGESAADTLGDLAGNTERKRTLCTDLEIVLHHDSPEADQNRRMQRQVELMESAMKGVDQNSPERIRELRLAYLQCGPAEPAVQKELEERFSKLLSATSDR